MFSIREAARAFIASLAPKRPYVRKPGAGTERSAVRLAVHASKQAARVAPAIAALRGRRAEHVLKRVRRWQKAHGRLNLDDAPSHIKNPVRP